MPEYLHPGVYVQEISTGPNTIQAVETAAPSFIGYTQRPGAPLCIASFQAFVDAFGEGPTPQARVQLDAQQQVASIHLTVQHRLHESVRLFYENGGGDCAIISVGTYADAVTLDALLGGLAMLGTEPLLAIPDAVQLTTADRATLYQAALLHCSDPVRRCFAVLDVAEPSDPEAWPEAIDTFRDAVGTANLKNGAAYTPYLNVAHAPAQLEVLDATGARVSFETNVEPLYQRVAAAVHAHPLAAPPSGAVLGIYAATDRARGVWKAPANVALSGVLGLTRAITEDQQTRLNVDPLTGTSVNALRTFADRGTVVWGARTLAGNHTEWRYVPTRRLLNMIEASINQGTAWVVFEPNVANTWVRVRHAIEGFLNGLWRDGALAGARADHAFFVNVGLGATMTPQDLLDGRLIIEAGLAAIRPAEFLILRVSYMLKSS
jgi:hypothetical protein